MLVEGGIGHQSARVTVATARLLHAAGVRVEVLSWNPLSLAGSTRAVSRLVRVPDAETAAETFADVSRDRLVLPTSDAAALGLSLPGSGLVDKRALYAHAGERGVPVPATDVYPDVESLRDAAGSLAYPVILKPSIGKPVIRARSAADVERFLLRVQPSTAILVQAVLHGRVHAVAGVARSGALLGVVHQVTIRGWPSASGTTTAAVTTSPDLALEALTAALVSDHDGIFHAQFLDGKVLDLNLRPYGSIALAAAAGANLPALCAALDAHGADEPIRARPGVRYRWIEADLRLAVARIRRSPGRTLSIAWEHRPRSGTAHGDASTVRDLGPAFGRLRPGRSVPRGQL